MPRDANLNDETRGDKFVRHDTGLTDDQLLVIQNGLKLYTEVDVSKRGLPEDFTNYVSTLKAQVSSGQYNALFNVIVNIFEESSLKMQDKMLFISLAGLIIFPIRSYEF